MAEEYVICEKSELVNIADSVRSKLGITDSLLLIDLPTLILDIKKRGGETEQMLLDVFGATKCYCGSIKPATDDTDSLLIDTEESISDFPEGTKAKFSCVFLESEKETKIPEPTDNENKILNTVFCYLNDSHCFQMTSLLEDEDITHMCYCKYNELYTKLSSASFTSRLSNGKWAIKGNQTGQTFYDDFYSYILLI